MGEEYMEERERRTESRTERGRRRGRREKRAARGGQRGKEATDRRDEDRRGQHSRYVLTTTELCRLKDVGFKAN